jgi:hypothetical protein
MIIHLRRFFASQKYFFAISVLFTLYLGVFFLNHFWSNSLIASLQLIGGLFFLVFGIGTSLTLILQYLLKRKFDIWEFISLSLLGSLLIPPLLLTIEFSLLNTVNSWCPLANSIVLWGIMGILLFLNKTSVPSLSLNKLSIKHPLAITFFFGIILILIQVRSFQTLPDLDPYKWLFKYTYQFANHLLDTSERPLFGAYIYIATTFMGIGIFDFFKYVLPFLSLLTLFPVWMIAKTFEEKNKQWLFLLFIFTSPNILLYATTAMPQATLISITYFFTLFLIYATLKQDNFFLYTAGLSMFLAFFYHQAAIIIFLAWVIPVVLAKRKKLLVDRKTIFLILLLLLSNLSRFQAMLDFMTHWAENILPSFLSLNHFNLLYPAQYSNIDNHAVGWSSLSGVLKFYVYYVGPMLGLVLLWFIKLLFQKQFRLFFLKYIRENLAASISLLAFILFFTIAEIFPRFPGIALLPDRAWIFCGIFSYFFLYLLLKYIPKISSRSMALFLLLFTVGLSGTIYINYLKRYLISPMQLESAEWIQSNLPNNRIFLSYGYRGLLPAHAETPLIRIPAATYCDKDALEFQKLLHNFNAGNNTLMKQTFLEKSYQPFLAANSVAINSAIPYLSSDTATIDEKYSSALAEKEFFTNQLDGLHEPLLNEKITIINPLSLPPQISTPIPNENIFRFNSLSSLDGKPLYVYYSQLNTRNPYRGRPYTMDSWGIEPCQNGNFLFDRYPDLFERVYSKKDASDEVIIWKLLFAPEKMSAK